MGAPHRSSSDHIRGSRTGNANRNEPRSALTRRSLLIGSGLGALAAGTSGGATHEIVQNNDLRRENTSLRDQLKGQQTLEIHNQIQRALQFTDAYMQLTGDLDRALWLSMGRQQVLYDAASDLQSNGGLNPTNYYYIGYKVAQARLVEWGIPHRPELYRTTLPPGIDMVTALGFVTPSEHALANRDEPDLGALVYTSQFWDRVSRMVRVPMPPNLWMLKRAFAELNWQTTYARTHSFDGTNSAPNAADAQ